MNFLKNVGIRVKLLIVTVPLMTALIAAIFIMALQIQKTESQVSEIYYDVLYTVNNSLVSGDRDFYQALIAATEHHMLSASSMGISDGDSAALIEDYDKNSKQVLENLHVALEAAKADEKLFHETKTEDGLTFAAAEETFEKDFEKWQSLYDVKNDTGDWDAFNSEFEETRNVLDNLQELTVSWAEQERDIMRRQIMTRVTVIAVIYVLLIVVLTVIAVMVIKGIRLGVQSVKRDLEEMAAGNLNIQFMDTSALGNDEIGQIMQSSQALISKLSEIIGNIKAAVETVDHSSSELAETADQIAHTTDGISQAVNGIATGAVQQAEEIQSANMNVEHISDAVGIVTDNTQSLEKTADRMNSESQQAAQELERLRQSAGEMSNSITEITDRINATSAAVANINEKVAAITSIATQTNLLALNASIEAARAGDAGRGFAVVAEEIGKLADDSAMSADQIRKEMEVLLGESTAAVKTAGEVQRTNEAQQEVINNTVDSIRVLIDAIETTVTGVSSIERSARQADESKVAVVDAMSSLSAISEENAASTEETGASMEELNATITVLAQSADHLKLLSKQLADDVSFFR